MINTPKLQFHTGLCGLSPHIIESFRSEKIFKITEPTIVGYTNVRARTHTGEKKNPTHFRGVWAHTHKLPYREAQLRSASSTPQTQGDAHSQGGECRACFQPVNRHLATASAASYPYL